jgi:citrate lyase gamma subunit
MYLRRTQSHGRHGSTAYYSLAELCTDDTWSNLAVQHQTIKLVDTGALRCECGRRPRAAASPNAAEQVTYPDAPSSV